MIILAVLMHTLILTVLTIHAFVFIHLEASCDGCVWWD